MAMTITERVAALLNSHPGVAFCDACIQAELKLAYRDSANAATRFLTRRAIMFVRVLGICGFCGASRLVTIANKH